MEEVIIRDEFIKLGQALKLAGLVESGVDAKMVISASVLAGILSLLTSVAGLPECSDSEGE